MPLPREAVAVIALKRKYGPKLKMMDDLLTLVLSLFREAGTPISKTRGLDRSVVHVTAGLTAKACKTYCLDLLKKYDAKECAKPDNQERYGSTAMLPLENFLTESSSVHFDVALAAGFAKDGKVYAKLDLN